MTGQPTVSIETAREHLRLGETRLAQVDQDTIDPCCDAAVATAHFSAAMAITNILLTDPAEWPPLLPEPTE